VVADQQQEAIEHGAGPCLVVAAPGSGKTHVVTQRFIRLVRDEGVQPHEILALTFTRRAVDEMLARVEDELGPISGDPPLTTYHAWAMHRTQLCRISPHWAELVSRWLTVRTVTAAKRLLATRGRTR
jgi:superfamily I DNA/RNA helicase